MIRSVDMCFLNMFNVHVLCKFMVKPWSFNLFCVSFSMMNCILGCMEFKFAKIFSILVVSLLCMISKLSTCVK
jgi:hypothetical protein